ncbi:MAG: glycosyltransferase [Chloroflexota bacterium]
MRILIVQESDWLKRGPHQQHQLADRLSLRGHQIRVMDFEILWRTQGTKGLYSRRQVFDSVWRSREGARITVIRPGIIKIPWLVYVSLIFTHKKEIERQVREFRPDVIIGFGILNTYLAARAAKRNAIPFVYYWIDVLHRLLPFKPFQLIARVVESKTLNQADSVLLINDRLKDFVLKMGAPAGRTRVLRAGFDIEQFKPEANTGNAIRESYGIKKGDTVLFFMGWLYRFSGLKEVATRLATNGHNLKLLVVGEGDAYPELQQIQQKYNLQERFILTGKKPYQEIPAFISASDICLLPACPTEVIMQDIVPIKMYEYMAMAKPVISTSLPGVVREFGEGNGVVYVTKPEDTVEKALELARGGDLKELGARARRFVERSNWDNITDEFEKILEEVSRGRSPSRKSS